VKSVCGRVPEMEDPGETTNRVINWSAGAWGSHPRDLRYTEECVSELRGRIISSELRMGGDPNTKVGFAYSEGSHRLAPNGAKRGNSAKPFRNIPDRANQRGNYALGRVGHPSRRRMKPRSPKSV
jgi:hypothetical protein